MHTSSTENSIAGSWSVFKITAESLSPRSRITSNAFLAANLSADPFDGTTIAFFILQRARVINLWPFSSPGKQ